MSILPNLTNMVKQIGEKICNKRTKRLNQPQRMESSFSDTKYDINVQIRQYRPQQAKALVQFQWTTNKTLNQKEHQLRKNAFNWLLNKCQDAFQLRHRTLELTMKLFDVYEHVAIEKNSNRIRENIFPEKGQVILDLLTILYMAAKYEEIYPPQLSEFISILNQDYTNADIIKNQIIIIKTIQTLNFTSVSDWYEFLQEKRMPYWAYFCYIGYNLSDTSQRIARDIISFIKQFKKYGDKQLKDLVDGVLVQGNMNEIFLSKFTFYCKVKSALGQEKNKATKTKKAVWK